MYEDSTRVGTTTATRQIPVSELLARHRGEQPRSQWDAPQWQAPAPNACETTDVIPVVPDEYYADEPYAATGYGEGYEYEEEPADAVRPFVGVSSDTDRFPLPVLHEDPDEQTLLAPIDVAAMDAERAAAEVAMADVAEAPTVAAPACDDTPSREIYIRELLRREGRLPREQRRKQAPKIAAAAAGVAALCGAVAASIVHVQSADNNQNSAGSGVPLTVVDGGGPRGQALDAPLAPRGTETVTPDSSTASGSTSTDKHASPPRVAPYVTKSQQAQNNNGGGTTPTSTATPTTTPASPPPASSNPPSTTDTTPPSPGNGGGGTPPTSSNSNVGGSSGNNSTPPQTSQPSGGGLLSGLVDPITGLLGL